MLGLTDTHSHLSYLEGRGIPKETIDSLFNEGFGFVLDVGTAPGDLAARIAGFSKYEKVRFACGIWPHKEILPKRREAIEQIENDIDSAPEGLVAAVGECGFDRRENPDAPFEERELFEMQLELAQKKALPLIVHSREAPQETLEALSRFSSVRSVIHCFSYGCAEVKKFLDLGCFISFAGNLTYKNAQNLREALPFVPKERLLLETDCPYLAPQTYRGKVCHPGLILETYRCAAALLGLDITELKERIASNARAFFSLRLP
ncbi:MAG: TatD family hydrolase [Spirochaetaceae bacterium]|jgi:TatD DNase family protein|nr:TatD family hydrolase [Spirochaetaceae bacterium]